MQCRCLHLYVAAVNKQGSVSAVIGWQRGIVVSVIRHMNEVTLCRARLVLGWVTNCGRVYHLHM